MLLTGSWLTNIGFGRRTHDKGSHTYVFKSGDEFNQTEKCDRSNKYIVSISNQNLGVQIFYYNVLYDCA